MPESRLKENKGGKFAMEIFSYQANSLSSDTNIDNWRFKAEGKNVHVVKAAWF